MIREKVKVSTRTLQWKCVESRVDSKRLYYGRFILSIIIAEPNAYIAFAGKRVIEQTLNKEVPEGSQSAEFLFEKGLFDSIVPRNLLTR